jgi:protoporphyrinogen oxidase
MHNSRIAVIGGGPAGLTAAYELARHGRPGTVFEADGVVGGIARTVEREGYRFDIGGHRFFTKVKEIEALWDEILGEPMLLRPRMSRIYFGGKFYSYPLSATNALRNMGPWTALACGFSYLAARLKPIANPANFEEWVTNQFGRKLYRMFFKSYTEKVWGCDCRKISADWAAQRIKGLSLGEAIRNAIFGQRRGRVITTLIDQFRYPRLGPGQLWEAAARTIQTKGWDVRLDTRVTRIELGEGRVTSIRVERADGTSENVLVDELLSSMPLRNLLMAMDPPPPPAVLSAAKDLAYRDFLTVALVLDAPDLFPDNWIYIHAPEVRVGRIQNFGNWSPEMVPDPATSCLGLEYFVNEGDDLWRMADDQLIELAYRELRTIGLATANLVKGFVVRIPKAYPVYDPGYKERLEIVRNWLATIANLHCIGRNGQHRYNNQDHSMATALIAARNVALGESRDPWAVNEDADYHEVAKTERHAPLTPTPTLNP